MNYLLLSLFSSALLSIGMRASERYIRNNISMLAVNYFTCAALASVLLQWNVSKNGVVLPAAFMKLGVLVPALLSVLVFKEKPGVLMSCVSRVFYLFRKH